MQNNYYTVFIKNIQEGIRVGRKLFKEVYFVDGHEIVTVPTEACKSKMDMISEEYDMKQNIKKI